MGHFANRLRTVAGRVPCLVVAAFLAAFLFPAAASAASLPVGTTFTGTITVGGTSYPCTYEVTGANTVQIGNGTDAAIDLHVAGTLSIPSSVSYGGDSYAVTSVGGAAFVDCTSLTSTGLEANSTVTTIGRHAFADCTSLASTGLEANSTVTTLGDYAFSGCDSLASTGLGTNSTVTTLGGYAFFGCDSLASTGLGTNSTVATIGEYAFEACTSLTSTGLEANSTVTTLEEGVFYDCQSLTSTGLGTNSTVTTLGPGAFEACTSLTSTGLEANSTVTTIGLLAFGGCRSLTSTGLEKNSTVTMIGYAAFAYCNSLTGDLVLGSAVSSVGPSAFVHAGLSAAYLLAADPSSVSVGDAAFDFSGSGDYASILYVPSSWDGTTSLATGSHTYRVSDGTLVIMDPAALSDVVASRSSGQDASVSFTPSASGTATIVDASGATVWTGTVSAGVPASVSLLGVGPAAASLTVRMGSLVYPSSATSTWYNTAAGCSAQVDVPASVYVISFDGNGSGSGSMADEAMTYGTAANLPANAYARDGYAFTGWSTSPDGSGTLYTDGQSVRDLAESGTVTLYAQWRANTVVPGGGNTTTTTVTTTTTATPRTGDPAGPPVACLLVASGLALSLARRYAVRARESRNG